MKIISTFKPEDGVKQMESIYYSYEVQKIVWL